MEITEVDAYLTENKDAEDVKALIAKFAPKLVITAENVQEFLSTDEGVKVLKTHPVTDERVTAAIKTHSEKQKPVVEAEIRRRVAEIQAKMNPEETEADKRIRELEEKSIAQEKRYEEAQRKIAIDAKSKEKNFALPEIFEVIQPPSVEEAELLMQKINKIITDRETALRNKLVGEESFKPGSGQSERGKVDIKTLTRDQMIKLEMEGKLDAMLAG